MAEILVPSRKIRRYGWIPSLPTLGEAVANVGGIEVKDEVDNRDVLSEFVFNQWALGACTANATGNHFRFDATLDGKDPGPLCRLGIYWGERKIEGTLGHGDTGAHGHDAFTVAKGGIPPETAWKYEWEGMEQEQPPPESYFDPSEEPSRFLKAKVAYKLTKQVATVQQTEDAIKAVLSNAQLIAFGFTVYQSFESQQVASTGIVPMPKRGENVLGGHETLICGYLKAHEGYFLVLNSWGKEWGLEGFFLMPIRYVVNRQLATDLRTIVRPL
jgi:C1A family cysteine protease